MNPFIAFCLYVAARVFVQYLKSRPEDATVKSSLQFLLTAMQALKGKNPLTESFLVQLDVDLEGSGVEGLSSATKSSLKRAMAAVPANSDTMRCSPLYDIRQSQSANAPILGEGADPGPLQSTNGTPMDFSRLFANSPYSANIPSRSKDVTRAVSTQGFVPASDYGEGMASNIHDIDMSPDTSDRQNSTSDHATPSTNSNKGSSHTSFTPPNIDQDPAASTTTNTNNNNRFYPSQNNSGFKPSMSPNTAAASSFAASFGQFFPTTEDTPKDPAGMEIPFGMAASWDYANSASGGGTGLTPTATGSGSGMSPLNEGQWTQMLEGMGWNGWPQEMSGQR